jgi:hypothetical protein
MPKTIDSALRNDPETGGQAGARKFQTEEPEYDLRGRLDRDLRCRRQRMNAGNGSSEALSCTFRVHRMRQSRDDVACIGKIEGRAQLGAFVEFIELPLGGFRMKMRRALAHDLRPSGRQEQLQPFHVSSPGELLPLVVHPENAEGEHRIH